MKIQELLELPGKPVIFLSQITASKNFVHMQAKDDTVKIQRFQDVVMKMLRQGFNPIRG
jgi:hypothetical protein